MRAVRPQGSNSAFRAVPVGTPPAALAEAPRPRTAAPTGPSPFARRSMFGNGRGPAGPDRTPAMGQQPVDPEQPRQPAGTPAGISVPEASAFLASLEAVVAPIEEAVASGSPVGCVMEYAAGYGPAVRRLVSKIRAFVAPGNAGGRLQFEPEELAAAERAALCAEELAGRKAPGGVLVGLGLLGGLVLFSLWQAGAI